MTIYHPNPTLLGADGRPLCADDLFHVNVEDQAFHGGGLYGDDLHEADFHEDDDPLFDAPPGESGHCPGEASLGAVRPRTGPALEVADIFRRFGQEYRSGHGHLLVRWIRAAVPGGGGARRPPVSHVAADLRDAFLCVPHVRSTAFDAVAASAAGLGDPGPRGARSRRPRHSRSGSAN